MNFEDMKKNKGNLSKLLNKVQEDSGAKKYQKDERFCEPSLDDDGLGTARIRFLPAPDNDGNPYVTVYNHGFKYKDQWFIEECPTTAGLPCPVCESNRALWATDQDTARARKRRKGYIANILVLEDPRNPGNVGKVFLWKFGPAIFKKIKDAIQPEFEDDVAINPFDFWAGADFKLRIGRKGQWRNYDKSEFADPSELFDGDEKKLKAIFEQVHGLEEFVAPDKFKSYEELQKRLAQVNSGVRSKKRKDDVEDEDDGDEDNAAPWEEENTPKPKKPSGGAVRKAKNPDEDDELAMYEKLMED